MTNKAQDSGLTDRTRLNWRNKPWADAASAMKRHRRLKRGASEVPDTSRKMLIKFEFHRTHVFFMTLRLRESMGARMQSGTGPGSNKRSE